MLSDGVKNPNSYAARLASKLTVPCSIIKPLGSLVNIKVNMHNWTRTE